MSDKNYEKISVSTMVFMWYASLIITGITVSRFTGFASSNWLWIMFSITFLIGTILTSIQLNTWYIKNP